MVEEYKYHVDEKSLTQDFLLKWVWHPIVDHLPAKLTPNTITIFGFLCMVSSSFFIWLGVQKQKPWGFAVAAFLVFIYMACDNVDGVHARRTKQSSKLGEYLDHWFDSINALVLNLCVANALFLNGWLLMICIMMVAISFFATIWEHHHTGIFVSGKIGTNEGLIVMIGLYLAFVFLFQHPFLSYSGYTDWNLASGVAYLTIAVCIVTTISILFRVKKYLREFLPLLLALTAVSCLFSQGMLSGFWASFLILAANIPFCARFLLERLCSLKLTYRGAVIVILSLLGIFMAFTKNFLPLHATGYLLGTALFLLGITMLWDLRNAILHLGKSTPQIGGSANVVPVAVPILEKTVLP